jgi:hypothetical protein
MNLLACGRHSHVCFDPHYYPHKFARPAEVLFLSPRRRSGERIKERGNPRPMAPPLLSPLLHRMEAREFHTGSAAPCSSMAGTHRFG